MLVLCQLSITINPINIMLKNIFKRSGKFMMAAAMASVVALPLVGSEAEAARGNTQGVFRNALSNAGISYTVDADNDIRIKVGDITIYVMVDDSNDVVRVWGWIPTSFPRSRWNSACVTCNDLNRRFQTQFWLDSDGDICCQWAFDTDDIAVSPAVAKAAVSRVLNGLNEAKRAFGR